MGDCCCGFEVEHIQIGIAYALGIDRSGLGSYGFPELLRTGGVNEFDLSPQIGEGVVE